MSKANGLPMNPLIGHNGEPWDDRTIAEKAGAIVALSQNLLCGTESLENLSEDGRYGLFLALDCAHDAMRYLADGERAR
jgi:hypothetical protein